MIAAKYYIKTLLEFQKIVHIITVYNLYTNKFNCCTTLMTGQMSKACVQISTS